MKYDKGKKPVVGIDIPWSTMANTMSGVVEFIPFARIENGKLLSPKVKKPYASLTILPEKSPALLELPIFHKIDFEHLWQAFARREKNKDEEVTILWSKDYKNRLLKLFSAYLPKLAVYIYPRGYFKKKWANPEWHKQFRGEAGFYKKLEELKPIASWKTDLIEWTF